MEWLDNLFDPAEISGWDAVFAVLIIVAGFIVGHFVKRWALAILTRVPGVGPGLATLGARLAKYAVILLGIGISLAILGANVQPLLALVVVVAVIGALALRGLADNFSAGIIIQSRRAIHIGQEIEVLDFTGTVTELNSRSVVISTRDGRSVHIPNSAVLNNPMVNHSELGGRRSDLEVRVETSGLIDDIVEAVRQATEQVAEGATEPVQVFVRSLSPTHATLEVRVWHAPMLQSKVTSAAVTSIYASLEKLGVASTVVTPIPPVPLTPPAKF